jgi:Ion transport protein/Cyclic nucleotide-binding domain
VWLFELKVVDAKSYKEMLLQSRRKLKDLAKPMYEQGQGEAKPLGNDDAGQITNNMLDSQFGSVRGRTDKKSPSLLFRRKMIQMSVDINSGEQKEGREKIGIKQRLDLYQFRKIQEQLNGSPGKSNIKKLRGAKRSRGTRKGTRGSSHALVKTDLQGRGCLIKPSGTFKRCWETFKFVVLIYTFAYLPLKITLLSNTEENYTDYTYMFDKTIDFIFLLDLVLSFFTPVMGKHDMITNHKAIAKAYLRGWFTLDLLTLIPFDDILTVTIGSERMQHFQLFVEMVKIARLFRLVKLLRLFKSFDFKNSDNYIINFLAQVSKGTPLLVVMPNFLLIVVSVHVYSCIYYFIGDLNTNNTGWIDVSKARNRTLFDQYIYTFYFVVQTFSTVGYGDVQSNLYLAPEILSRIAIIFSGVLIFSVFTGQIVETRNNALIREEELDLKENKLRDIVKQYNLPDKLYYNIVEHLREPKDVIKPYDFSALTKDELDTFDYNKFVNKFYGVPLFSEEIEDRNFVLDLGRAAKPKHFLKDQMIYERGEPAVNFFILIFGQVQVESANFESVPICTIKKGYFGEYEMIENINRAFTVRASKECLVYTLPSSEFKKLFITTEEREFSEHYIQKAKDRYYKLKELDEDVNNFFVRKLFWRTVFKNKSKKKQNKESIEGLLGPTKMKTDGRRKNKFGTLNRFNRSSSNRAQGAGIDKMPADH